MIAFMGLGCYTRDRAVEKKREKRELLKLPCNRVILISGKSGKEEGKA
jgi:hypothetical protein